MDGDPVARDVIQIGGFVLDGAAQSLSHGERQVPLRQKAYLVLRRLAESPGVLLSADELHDAAWPGLAVTPQTLTNVISELRKLTRLDPRGSLRIETRYGRGYRLVVERTADTASATQPSVGTSAAPSPRASGDIFVGRTADMTRLEALWHRALAGERQIVWLAGTAGIGKTTLIDAFAASLDRSALVIARGRCVVRRGESEAYAPLLDALEEITRDIDLVDDLRRCAPSWLAQMPWLLPADETTALRRSLLGSGALRPLREGVKLIEQIASRRPLLLVLEDVHDADASTIDLLAALIERTAPARLLVLASYRPADAFLRGALAGATTRALRGPCVTRLVLEPLSSAGVRSYLEQRFGDPRFGDALTPALEEKSGGNPLFLREIVDTLLDRGQLVEAGDGWRLTARADELRAMLPDGIRDLIAEHLARLPAEHIELLEAASVAGAEFTVSVVAAALEQPLDDVARACRTLATQGPFVLDDGERAMPDGSVVEAFRFAHALYQQALGERLGASLRRPLHARIGAQLEREYGARVAEIASRLALHFEAAEDWEKALLYLQVAGLAAAERHAYRDTAELARRAIAASRRLPATPDRARHRIELLLIHGNLRIAVGGFHDAEARTAYESAFAEASALGDVRLRFRAQAGRFVSALFCGAPGAASMASDLVAMADAGHPELATVAHHYSAFIAEERGDFRAVAEHVRLAEELLPQADPGIPQHVSLQAHVARAATSVALIRGDHAAWSQQLERALAVARERALPVDRSGLLAHLAASALIARDAQRAIDLADEAIAIGEQHGIARLPMPGLAHACRAWSACALHAAPWQGLLDAIEERDSSGERWFQGPLLVSLAELQVRSGDLDAARASLDRAVASDGVEHAAEVERVAGELALAALERSAESGDAGADARLAAHAQRCFEAAVAIAREQGALLFEKRAVAACARRQ